MSRSKNKHGLTPQQEMFCQYVVDAYGTDTRGVLVSAYRKAYNCRSDSLPSTHWSNASRLMANSKVKARVEELEEERARMISISREKLISDDVRRIELDPLELWIFDEEKKVWRMRYIHEIPRHTRKLLKFVRSGKRLIPDVDKDAAIKRLIDVLGYASAKDLNITSNNVRGELRIGFDDESE